MKSFVLSFVACIAAMSITGVASAAQAPSRIGVQRDVIAVPRMPSVPTSSVNIKMTASNLKSAPTSKQGESTVPADETEPEVVVDKREKEREACLRNNIGIGNTFVWASRYSDTSDYSLMIEDVEHPENNVCFAFVELKSTDPNVNLSDIKGKYFEMGNNIMCASWVDEKLVEKRILDAKKKKRTLATIGGAVGSAAIGVTSMELFGNKLLSNAGVKSVEGQKALEDEELLRSQLLVMKKEKPTQYADVVSQVRQIEKACGEITVDKPDACTSDKFTKYTTVLNEIEPKN